MSAAASPVSSTKPMTTKNQKAALVFSMEFSFPQMKGAQPRPSAYAHPLKFSTPGQAKPVAQIPVLARLSHQ